MASGLLRGERDGQVRRALADARRAAHRSRAEPLERRDPRRRPRSRSAAPRRRARGCAPRWRPPTRAACSRRLATPRGVKARMARASATSLPRMWSQTSRALRAEVRTYLAWARDEHAPARLRRGGGAAAGRRLRRRLGRLSTARLRRGGRRRSDSADCLGLRRRRARERRLLRPRRGFAGFGRGLLLARRFALAARLGLDLGRRLSACVVLGSLVGRHRTLPLPSCPR